MKKFIAWFLVLALTAAVSIGATLAYLMDTDEDVNVMTIGKVKIDQLEYERVDTETADDEAKVQEFHDNKPLLPAVTEEGFTYVPGDTYVDWDQIGKDGYTSTIWDPTKINNEVDKMVFVKNKGKSDAFVRTVFAFEAGNYETLDQFQSMVHLNLNETDWTWEWMQDTSVTIGESKYFIATATYNKVLEPGKLTEISLSQIALDKTATNADVEAFGETYQILVKSQAIQTAGFDDADTALNEGFGEITGSNIPWENDSPITGATVFNAVHYLNADPAGTDIKTKVASITFGLTKDHAAVADDYTGTLVDVEQDVPVYAYYVPSGSNYDVYLLANDKIYAPANSAGMFKGMSKLETVDMENLDVSRVETMKQWFRECSSLTSLNTAGWDTSRVTDMAQMFYKCSSLQEISGIEDWDTGAVTSLKAMFREAGIEGDLNLSGWDVSNVTTMQQMFYKASNTFSLNAEGWDTGACTDMSYFLTQSSKVQSVNAAGWDTSSVTNMYGMFYENFQLKTLDVTGWDTSNVTNAGVMFTRCRGLESLIGSGGLDWGKLTAMNSMFEGMDSLTYLDVTNWNCGSCTNMDQMFAWALKLETLEGLENWDVSNVKSMSGVFYCCYDLKEVNVTGWDVSEVTTMSLLFASENQNKGDMKLERVIGLETWNPVNVTRLSSMFYGCGTITEVNLSGWDMPKLTTVSHMFADCFNLKSIDFSNWNTPSLQCMDAIFNDCRAIKMIDVSSFDTANVNEFSQVFEACYSLKEIIGLDQWVTTSGHDYAEMFSGCTSLKKLDLSTFDTRGANKDYLYRGQSENEMFKYMFSSMDSLEEITFGPYFSFDGDGTVEKDAYRFKMPASGAEGWDGHWYDAEGNAYLPSEIPEETARTYYAVNPVANP